MPSAKSRANRVSSATKSATRFVKLNRYLRRLKINKARLREITPFEFIDMNPRESRKWLTQRLDAYEPDARAKAILRGNQQKLEDLKAAGGAFTLQQVQALLGDISRQAVHKKVKEGHLLAVQGPNDTLVYPTAQFMTDGSLVSGLKALQEALPTKNPWAVLNYLVQPEGLMDGRVPLDVLKEGGVERVVAAAERYGQMGS